MQGGQTTTSVIPLVGTFEQIKAGLGFGPKRAESKLDATVDGIAGLINTIAEPQGRRLNRFTTEWADLIDDLEAGARGVPLAEKIIAMAATQGIQITLDQLLRDPAPQTFLRDTGFITPPPVIPSPPVATRIAAPISGGSFLGARGLGLTAPSGFPILPPSGGPAPTVFQRGLNAARFIQCLIASLLPTRTGGAPMPFITTPGFAPSAGSLDFGGFGGILQSGLQLASNIFSKPQAPAERFPSIQQAGFPLLAGARSLFPALAAGGVGGASQGFIESLFRSGGAGDLDERAAFTDPIPGRCRPKAHVKENPCTGKEVWFTPRGRPLVFSGDMAACRRVDRVAKRLDKARPKRRHHHHPR